AVSRDSRTLSWSVEVLTSVMGAFTSEGARIVLERLDANALADEVAGRPAEQVDAEEQRARPRDPGHEPRPTCDGCERHEGREDHEREAREREQWVGIRV